MRAPRKRATSEWRKAYYRNKIKEYVDYLGGKCVKCGAMDNLNFDHIDAKTKKFEITSNHDRRWDFVQPELDKCQLLCVVCHREKGLLSGDIKEAKHGTLSMYRHCRCELCKTAWNLYHKNFKRNWRKKRKAALVIMEAQILGKD